MWGRLGVGGDSRMSNSLHGPLEGHEVNGNQKVWPLH